MFTPLPDVVVASRYRLVREIGRGGMGCVWEAFDLELRAPCALKFILEQAAELPEMRTRFLREARGVAKLQSPHVVSIRSVGEHDDALYIAMELLHGETLRERIEREGTLTPSDTLTLVQQVASVLTLAHEAGIVHRDLKPENIWLWSNPDLFVKVIDFGVAKHLSEGESSLRTATGALVGTPRYMSPEQAAGDKSVDHRTDLWSLALIAAECLSGRAPFDSCGLRQVLITIILGPVPSMAEMYAAATPELEAWWRHATANRAHRFQTAHELAQAFATALTAREPMAPTLLTMPVSEWSSTKRENAPPLDATVRQPDPSPARDVQERGTSPSWQWTRALWGVGALVVTAALVLILVPLLGSSERPDVSEEPALVASELPPTPLSYPFLPAPLAHEPLAGQGPNDDERAVPGFPTSTAEAGTESAPEPRNSVTESEPETAASQTMKGSPSRRELDRDSVYRPVEEEVAPFPSPPPPPLNAEQRAPSQREAQPSTARESPAGPPVRSGSPPAVDSRIGF